MNDMFNDVTTSAIRLRYDYDPTSDYDDASKN